MPVQDYTYEARCLNVVDGDTVDCSVDLGFRLYHTMRLRLLRINAPELNSTIPEQRELAKRAKEFVQTAIVGNTIMIQTSKSDSFGRWLAEIWYKDSDGKEVNLNDQLLSLGLAVEFKK